MEFRLTIAGDLPEKSLAYDQVEQVFTHLKRSLPAQGLELRLLVSPSYTDESWKSWATDTKLPLSCYTLYGETEWDDMCTNIFREETPLRDLLGEELCDGSDLILMVWNEKVAQRNGACWELLQLANKRGTPCVWVSSATGRIYWAQEAYYEPFRDSCLEELCHTYSLGDAEPYQLEDKKIPLLNLGIWLRKRYMRKHAALGGKVDAERDDLMFEDFSMEGEVPGGETIRKRLLNHFKKFDDSAITLNSRYQAVIYWRAILPFITSIFCAIGFYAEGVLGLIPAPAWLWPSVAGIGFLIHGLLNLYVYLLSKNELIKRWHRGFLHDRYVAEVLRVLIHFVPYGVNLNLRKLCGGNQQIYMTVQRAIGRRDGGTWEISKASTAHMLRHVEQMLDDQIAYHTVSQRRYSGIVKKLESWYKWAFGIGFVVILLRALAQLAMGLMKAGGVAVPGYASSIANMLALLLPGWASYFSTKLDMCNFRYNAENHSRMILRLTEVKNRIENMRRSVDLPLEALNDLAEDLAEIMLLEDTNAWYRQYQGSTVKML